MKMKLVKLLVVSVVMLIASTASAEIINTYNGPITVTSGTVAYGEVGTLLNPLNMGNWGIGGTWSAPSSPADYAAVLAAGSTLDHYWVQSLYSGGAGNPTGTIMWSLTTPVNAVLGFPGNDHGPLPMENLEYKMWGSNDWTDSSSWVVGTLTAIYKDGWEDPTQYTLPGGLKDSYATRWDFTQNYQYFKTVGTSSVVQSPDGSWWTDFDPEMDGIAAVPVPGAVLLGMLGLSVAGIKLRKHA